MNITVRRINGYEVFIEAPGRTPEVRFIPYYSIEDVLSLLDSNFPNGYSIRDGYPETQKFTAPTVPSPYDDNNFKLGPATQPGTIYDDKEQS